MDMPNANTLRQPRNTDGRFSTKPACDACGKPCTGEHFTDGEACGSSDGPGFYLCERKRCEAKRPEGLEERKAFYAAQREKNEAAAAQAAA